MKAAQPEPGQPEPVKPEPAPAAPQAREIPAIAPGSGGAPFLFFDQASAFGYAGGIVRVTLEATTILATGRVVSNERVVVGHLRMGLQAAQSLRAALDKALLMAAPPETETKN